MLLEKITDSLSWFFRITLAKIRTFHDFFSSYVQFQHFSGRDVHEIFLAETKTRPETHVSETETRLLKAETRRCSFLDASRDLEAFETQILKNEKSNFRTFQDQWEPWSLSADC